MATVASSLKSLNLYFKDQGSDKLFKVQVKDPAEHLSSETVKAAAEEIVASQVFDFEGYADDAEPYQFVKAMYYTRSSRAVIK